MKICHVNYARGFRGGERQTLLLIESLADKGIDQELIARRDSPLHDKLAAVPNLVCNPITKPYAKNLRLLKAMQPDLIHAHDAKAAQWSLLAYWLYGLPYIMTRRISKPSRNVAFTRAVYRNAAQVVGLSKAVRDSIHTLLPGLNVEIIPSVYANLPFNEERLKELQQQYKDKFVIGHIGALVNPHKGQAVLIEAIRQLNTKYDNLHFLLLGSGKDEKYLRGLAAGLHNIEFVGFVEDVGTWINLFDLFVFPSLEEGLGSTLLDVMQHKKPVLASAVGGILDVIENRKNGLLVPPADPEHLARGIEEMYQDKGLRDRLAMEGQRSINKFSPNKVAECYHQLYDLVLSRSGDRF